jgi:S-formylglutathione hydrolase
MSIELEFSGNGKINIRKRKTILLFRHSMGGHGALISYFKRPAQYKSVSAFAPICNVSKSEWGINAYTKFFGQDETLWKQYDATELVASYHGPMPHAPVLIDQGSDDSFKDKHLFPERFIDACKKASFPIELREQAGYDHGYYFIMTFLEDHFKYHKKEFEHLK